MKKLGYETLEELGYTGYLLKKAPEKVLQFGEGNFMRAFVDYWVDLLNEKGGFNGKVVVTTPIAPPPGFDIVSKMNQQEGLYTLYLRGLKNGAKVNEKRIISAISRCLSPQNDFQSFLDCAKNPELIILTSNTTEAGIVYDPEARFGETPPASFPAKLCRFLFERWQNDLPGFVILACELIDHNGDELKRIVLRHCKDWELGDSFTQWVNEENAFCSTLVDRIVPGYPRSEADQINAENGYTDELLDTGEIFGFWVIEGPQSIKKLLPIDEAEINDRVLVVNDSTPYKQRKVRILNGAHTAFVPAAYFSGQNLVRECMDDQVIRTFMEKAIFEEIIPSITTLPVAELNEFASSVVDRFQNPYIDHQLLSISLNSTSKWRARVLPSLLAFYDIHQMLPTRLTFSFAGYLAFYRGCSEKDGEMYGKRPDGNAYKISDDQWVLDFFAAHSGEGNATLAHVVCTNTQMWGQDLSLVPGFESQVVMALNAIDEKGIYAAMRDLK